MTSWLWLAPSEAVRAQTAPADTTRVVEVRSYNLKPGARDRFHALFLREALPMLERWKVDLVAYGPSLHDADSYYLMRGFPGIDQRQRSEDAFYGSDELQTAPPSQGDAMPDRTTTASDLAALTSLNADYIRSVQTSDVQRFRDLLAEDFLCSQADGSLIDRARFLDVTARPVTITNLQAHDVNVRLMGDFAIVHARTTYTTADGKAGAGRYTDVWARRSGRWVAVSAHVTRN